MKLFIITIPLFTSLSIFFFSRNLGKTGTTILAILSIFLSSIIS